MERKSLQMPIPRPNSNTLRNPQITQMKTANLCNLWMRVLILRELQPCDHRFGVVRETEAVNAVG
jgi:hypothetical protein